LSLRKYLVASRAAPLRAVSEHHVMIALPLGPRPGARALRQRRRRRGVRLRLWAGRVGDLRGGTRARSCRETGSLRVPAGVQWAPQSAGERD
jgi:hypothetical protein